jgi:hypothetical protein
LLGSGNGVFRDSYLFAGRSPREPFGQAYLADFNGDGNLDVATQSESLFLGLGNGRLRTPTPFGPIGSFAVADVNRDGLADIVLNTATLLSNGDGTFRSLPSPVAPGSTVNLGDLNHDGALDILAANSGGVEGFEAYLGNGNGTFRAPQSVAPGIDAFGLAIGDFNGDGFPDLVVPNFQNGQLTGVAVLLNDRLW